MRADGQVHLAFSGAPPTRQNTRTAPKAATQRQGSRLSSSIPPIDRLRAALVPPSRSFVAMATFWMLAGGFYVLAHLLPAGWGDGIAHIAYRMTFVWGLMQPIIGTIQQVITEVDQSRERFKARANGWPVTAIMLQRQMKSRQFRPGEEDWRRVITSLNLSDEDIPGLQRMIEKNPVAYGYPRRWTWPKEQSGQSSAEETGALERT